MIEFLATLLARLTTGATTYTWTFIWDEPELPEE